MKKFTLFSLVLSFGLIMGCSDSDSSSDSLKGKKCTENETVKCKSADTPNLAYLCINGKWTDADLSNVVDREANVCVVLDGKDVEMPECPANTEGSHATVLPHYDPICAVAECAKDSRGVLYTKEYSLVCKDGGGKVSGNTCDCGTESDPGSDLAGTKCDKDKGDTLKCKSPDTPNLAYWCDMGIWKEINLAAVDDKEADVCVIIDGKDTEKPECPADSEGSHATVLPHFDPVCAVAECAKDSRGVLYTKEYSLVCKDGGGKVSGNTCDCGTEDE